MPGKLFILSGASGCGKTTLLNHLCGVDREPLDPQLRASRAPKYSERERRNEFDDITHDPKITLDRFDVAYVLNNTRYGLRISEIEDLLNDGHNAFIVLSDFRVVREVKRRLGNQARSIYISSAIDAGRLRRIQEERLGFRPDEDQKRVLSYHFARVGAAARLNWWNRVSDCVVDLERDWRAYASDSKSTEIRAQKIRAFHIRYIEHLHLFDHVILNYTENAPEEMSEQARSLIVKEDLRGASNLKFPPVFVVAAPSGAGKGTLMEMLNFIGGDQIKIVSKVATRRPKTGDRRDGMVALGRGSGDPEPEWPSWWSPEATERARRGEIPDEYDLRWTFGKRGITYAVSQEEVQNNVDSGHAQILVSNMGEFERFRQLWPNHAVFVYLHRLSSDEEHREYQRLSWPDDSKQAELRIRERRWVHEEYIRRIGEFHHVLLNTSFQEDMYDQMFHLVAFYRSGVEIRAA